MQKKLRESDANTNEGLIEATENNANSSTHDVADSLDPKKAYDKLVTNENALQAEKVLRSAMLAAEGLIDPNIFGRWCEVVAGNKYRHPSSL